MTKISKEDQPGVPVAVSYEIVERVEDILSIVDDGEQTLGYWLDKTINDARDNGQHLGEITLDLSEFSRAFIPIRMQR